MDNIPIPPNSPLRQLDTEFSKHITATSFLEAMFNKKLCGWREINSSNTINTPFGSDEILKKEYVINRNTRLCNEDCSSFVRAGIEGAINHLTQTGKLTAEQIYNEWNALFYDLLFSLIRNYADEGNTYQLKNVFVISVITTYAISFNTVTYKALEGFTLEEIAEYQLTHTLINAGAEKKPSTASGITGIFSSIFGSKKQGGNS